MAIRHGLLALLDEGPAYGYQLKAAFEERTGGTWLLNIGQVYTTLARAERDGLVAHLEVDDEGRVIYEITAAGREVVARWTSFYKQHRAILDSDIIHGRRPDARDIDFYLHVNPRLEEKALVMAFNPLDTPAEKDLVVPLYYAGVKDRVTVVDALGKSRDYTLDRDHRITLPVKMKPQDATWFIVRNRGGK